MQKLSANSKCEPSGCEEILPGLRQNFVFYCNVKDFFVSVDV